MTPEAKDFFRGLVRTMGDFGTTTCVDERGTFWALGRWYGEGLHFRCNFGHWSEAVLDLNDPRALTLEPWVDYREPAEEQRAWGEFYSRGVKDE